MFIRFFYICCALLALILGCTDADRTPNTEATLSADGQCPQLSLRASPLTEQSFERLRQMVSEPAMSNAAIAQIVEPMLKADQFSSRQRLVLKQAALRYAQSTTLKHFMDYGRRLAESAIIANVATLNSDDSAQLPAHETERFLSALTQSPPPTNQAKTPHERAMRYILLMWSWASILEDRVQLSQWWHPWEYQWLLEARVLGHFGLELKDRLRAHSQLLHAKGYPFQWNEAVLTIWSKDTLSDTMIQTLSESLPTDCIKRLESM